MPEVLIANVGDEIQNVGEKMDSELVANQEPDDEKGDFFDAVAEKAQGEADGYQ